MSNQQQTLSLNMDRSNAVDCVLKCAFSFKYPETNVTVLNDGASLKFTLDDTSNSPSVVFNNKKYSPSYFKINYPSIHTFNNVRPAGEIVIYHTPENANSPGLSIYIPIIASNNGSDASEIVTELINYSKLNANTRNSESNLNTELSLQSILPKTSFYYYNTSGLQNIVFDSLYGIAIRSSILTDLNNIISRTTIPTNMGYRVNELFYNPNGPSKEYIGDGIYISCRPTGSSDEKTGVIYNAKKSMTNSEYLDVNYMYYLGQFWMVVVFCILFVIFIYLFKWWYGYLTGDTSIFESFKHMGEYVSGFSVFQKKT